VVDAFQRQSLDAGRASRFARIALENVAREYPYKPGHLLTSAADLVPPRTLHPIFYGSYDWHSSVHMHWTLVTLLARFPDLPEAGAIGARLDAHFTAERVAGELAYLVQPAARSFERPYGWAWLLKLAEALVRAGDEPRFAAWRVRLQPMVDLIVERTIDYLPRAPHPARVGAHANNAFACLLSLDYAIAAGHAALEDAISAQTRAWFAADRVYPVEYELGSEDFLSNGLLEAVLMRRVLQRDDGALAEARFYQWWDGFVPDKTRLSAWLVPVLPSDRADARLTHIDGLNLARAWCWSQLVDAMPEALQTPVRIAIHAQRAESLPHADGTAADGGHYVGTHWLASFALLAFGA
jgi:Protein of unknown function (DUF2891)